MKIKSSNQRKGFGIGPQFAGPQGPTLTLNLMIKAWFVAPKMRYIILPGQGHIPPLCPDLHTHNLVLDPNRQRNFHNDIHFCYSGGIVLSV